MNKSNDDCYFYFYSSCKKGDDCPYRHCRAALGTETVCSSWSEGRCFRENCKFRHMTSRINRTSIPCYWEKQHKGCLKPHCVFKHEYPRTNISINSGNEKLILPVSTVPSQNTTKASEANDFKTVFNSSAESYSSHMSSPDLSPVSHPVDPIVVSVGGEESDSESACSTPMKPSESSRYNDSSVKKNLMDDLTDKKENNFGIKTLEQLRIEKIHRESEHLYKDDIVDVVTSDKSGVVRNATFLNDTFSLSVYDSSITDMSLKLNNKAYKAECHPESDFTSVSDLSSRDEAICSIDTVNHETAENEGLYNRYSLKRKQVPPYSEQKSDFTSVSDLSARDEAMCSIDAVNHETAENEGVYNRYSLKRKLTAPYSERTVPPCKKVVSLKRKSKDDDPFDFKIKTLEEIRKEREGKLVNEETTTEQSATENMSTKPYSKSNSSNTSPSSNLTVKTLRKLKIKRQTKESLSNSVVLSEVIHTANHSNESQDRENRTQMILHEVQNISEEQNKSDVKGKRKEIEDSSMSRSPKQSKTELSPNSNILPHPSEVANNSVKEKQVKKVNRPIIKRNRSSSSISPPLPSTKQSPVSEIEKTLQNSAKNSSISETDEKEELVSTSSKEPKTPRSSVDDLDNFLFNEGELPLDYEPDASVNEPEEILQEIEELLKT